MKTHLLLVYFTCEKDCPSSSKDDCQACLNRKGLNNVAHLRLEVLGVKTAEGLYRK